MKRANMDGVEADQVFQARQPLSNGCWSQPQSNEVLRCERSPTEYEENHAICLSDLQLEILSLHDDNASAAEEEMAISSPEEASDSDQVEPDSLVEDFDDRSNSSSPDVEAHHADTDLSRDIPSRTSLGSQKSVSYFVDLGTANHREVPNKMVQSVFVPRASDRKSYPPATVVKNDLNSERMAQSLYVRSDSRTSQGSVSFFVDFANGNGRETQGHAALVPKHPVPPKVMGSTSRRRSSSTSLELARFFRQIREYVDFLEEPCYSKEEVRRKKDLAEKLGQIIWDGETKIAQGQGLPSQRELEDQVVLNGSKFGSDRGAKGPIFAFFPEEDRTTSVSLAKPPGLRRERTFDLDPGTSVRDIKVVDINFDESPTATSPSTNGHDLSPDEERDLASYQKYRILNVRKLKKEVDKLEKIERELIMKASFCGPEPLRCWESSRGRADDQLSQKDPDTSRKAPVPRPRTKIPVPQPLRPARKCDYPLPDRSLNNFTTLAVSTRRSVSTNEKFHLNITDPIMSASCSMVDTTPISEYPPPLSNRLLVNKSTLANLMSCERESQTGDSLLRTYKSKLDRSVTVRDRPQAYFLSCEEEAPPVPIISRRTSVQTKVIDLESQDLPPEASLQEALQARRPDYIARTKSRENSRVAKKMVQQNRQSIIENIPTGSIHQSPRDKIRAKLSTDHHNELEAKTHYHAAQPKQPQIKASLRPLVGARRTSIKSSTTSTSSSNSVRPSVFTAVRRGHPSTQKETSSNKSKIPTSLQGEKAQPYGGSRPLTNKSSGSTSQSPSPYSNSSLARKHLVGVPKVNLPSKKPTSKGPHGDNVSSRASTASSSRGVSGGKLNLVGARGSKLSTLSPLVAGRVRVP